MGGVFGVFAYGGMFRNRGVFAYRCFVKRGVFVYRVLYSQQGVCSRKGGVFAYRAPTHRVRVQSAHLKWGSPRTQTPGETRVSAR
jgi:hypothetical protein